MIRSYLKIFVLITLFFISQDANLGFLQKIFCSFSVSAVHPLRVDHQQALSVIPSTESAGETQDGSINGDKLTDFILAESVEPAEAPRLEDYSQKGTIISLRPLSDDHFPLRRVGKFRKSTPGTYAPDILVDLDAEDVGIEPLSFADFESIWKRSRREIHDFKELISDFRRRFTMAKDVGLFSAEPVQILAQYAESEKMYTTCFRYAEILRMGTPMASYCAYTPALAFPEGDYKIRYLGGRECLIDGCTHKYRYMDFRPKCILCRKNVISAIYNDKSLKPQEKLNDLVKVIAEMYKNLTTADEMNPVRH